MAKINNTPITSFINFFKNIIYDDSIESNYSLDIWDAYVISPFFKNEISYFLTHIVKTGDNWVALANKYYKNDRLWWVIPLFNDTENPFLIFDKDLYNNETKEIKILKPQYIEQLIMIARQEKILNDRLLKEGKIN